MKVCFLDANVIIRYVTQDDASLSQKAKHILTKIKAGEVTATTCESIITECVYVLSSKRLYNLSRPQIAGILTIILSFKGLKIPHKRVYQKALELYAATRLDFPDALAAAHMKRQNITQIYSFDTDFDQLTGIKRLDR